MPAVERGVPGLEVLALELLSPSRFCVYIDHPEGVDHALCARVTALLDRYREQYTIDVSSPGLDRPVRKPEHFARAVGRTVELRTDGSVAGKKRFRAEVLGAGERSVRLATSDTELDIPYDAIVRGNLIGEVDS